MPDNSPEVKKMEDTYYSMYKDYTKSVIMKMLNDSSMRAIKATTLAEGRQALAEQQACTRILNKFAEFENKKKGFADSEDERREEIFRNLKYASTLNGQIVIALLNEEGPMKQSEIHQWCDELKSLSDSEFYELLKGLYDEYTIDHYDIPVENDDRYPYTPLYEFTTYLLPPRGSYTEWAVKYLKAHRIDIDPLLINFIRTIEIFGPMYAEDFIDEYNSFENALSDDEFFTSGLEIENDPRHFRSHLHRAYDIIRKKHITTSGLDMSSRLIYYIPFMGEGR